MKIGVIGAMEEEVAALIQSMSVTKKEKIAAMIFYEGVLWGKEAVVVQSGIGKVNMAVCTQILIDQFQVTRLVNTGVAGGLKEGMHIGDIVISTDAMQHDMNAEGFGYQKGEIPRMTTSVFVADEKMVKEAQEVCQNSIPDVGCYVGRVVSGDQFISDSLKKKELSKTFEGVCAEMEGAAMAQTAYLNEIPFVILRAVSDHANDDAKMDYQTFEHEAIGHLIRLIHGIFDKE